MGKGIRLQLLVMICMVAQIKQGLSSGMKIHIGRFGNQNQFTEQSEHVGNNPQRRPFEDLAVEALQSLLNDNVSEDDLRDLFNDIIQNGVQNKKGETRPENEKLLKRLNKLRGINDENDIVENRPIMKTVSVEPKRPIEESHDTPFSNHIEEFKQTPEITSNDFATPNANDGHLLFRFRISVKNNTEKSEEIKSNEDNKKCSDDFMNLWKTSVPVLVQNNKSELYNKIDYNDLSKDIPEMKIMEHTLKKIHKPGHLTVLMLNPKNLNKNSKIDEVRRQPPAQINKNGDHLNIKIHYPEDKEKKDGRSREYTIHHEIDTDQINKDKSDGDQDMKDMLSKILNNLPIFHEPDHLSAISFNPKNLEEKKDPNIIHVKIKLSSLDKKLSASATNDNSKKQKQRTKDNNQNGLINDNRNPEEIFQTLFNSNQNGLINDNRNPEEIFQTLFNNIPEQHEENNKPIRMRIHRIHIENQPDEENNSFDTQHPLEDLFNPSNLMQSKLFDNERDQDLSNLFNDFSSPDLSIHKLQHKVFAPRIPLDRIFNSNQPAKHDKMIFVILHQPSQHVPRPTVQTFFPSEKDFVRQEPVQSRNIRIIQPTQPTYLPYDDYDDSTDIPFEKENESRSNLLQWLTGLNVPLFHNIRNFADDSNDLLQPNRQESYAIPIKMLRNNFNNENTFRNQIFPEDEYESFHRNLESNQYPQHEIRNVNLNRNDLNTMIESNPLNFIESLKQMNDYDSDIVPNNINYGQDGRDHQSDGVPIVNLFNLFQQLGQFKPSSSQSDADFNSGFENKFNPQMVRRIRLV